MRKLATSKGSEDYPPVAPAESRTLTYSLGEPYLKVLPVGGGEVEEDGSWSGSLRYEVISGTLTHPPTSASLLLSP